MSTITQTAQSVPTGTWKLDKLHSQVGYAVKHGGVSIFKGGLSDFDAVLDRGTLRGAANVASITIEDENFAQHLLSPEFFDVERTPQVTFTSTAIQHEGDRLVVDGELEIRGEKRPVRLTGTIAGPVNDKIGIELETTIDRTDFGITWNMELPAGGFVLENEVTLTADLELAKA